MEDSEKNIVRHLHSFQVCEKGQSQNWQRVWLDSEKGWYMTNGDQWITYEDVDSAALKVRTASRTVRGSMLTSFPFFF